MLHVLLSGTPRVRIVPGTPKSLKTLSFGLFSFAIIHHELSFTFLPTFHENVYPVLIIKILAKSMRLDKLINYITNGDTFTTE